MADVTQILSRIEHGDPKAAEQLLPLVYDELRRLAAARLAKEKPGQTLQATALVHEAYLGLINESATSNWNSRGHFFGAAAEAMRRILVERARRAGRLKRGGNLQRVDEAEIEIAVDGPSIDVLALDEALGKLGESKPQVVALIKLRYFVGMTVQEAADALDISTSTADRHWTYARAWLYRELLLEDDGS